METAEEVKLKSNEKSIKCEKSINLSLKVYSVPSSASSSSLFVVICDKTKAAIKIYLSYQEMIPDTIYQSNERHRQRVKNGSKIAARRKNKIEYKDWGG